jgi:predicted nuclease with TOPRIM domain
MSVGDYVNILTNKKADLIERLDTLQEEYNVLSSELESKYSEEIQHYNTFITAHGVSILRGINSLVRYKFKKQFPFRYTYNKLKNNENEFVENMLYIYGLAYVNPTHEWGPFYRVKDRVAWDISLFGIISYIDFRHRGRCKVLNDYIGYINIYNSNVRKQEASIPFYQFLHDFSREELSALERDFHLSKKEVIRLKDEIKELSCLIKTYEIPELMDKECRVTIDMLSCETAK